MSAEIQQQFDEIHSRITVMRLIVARLLAHESRHFPNPDDLFRPISEGLDALLARTSERTGQSPIDLEEMMRTELEWFLAAARKAR